MTENNQHKKRRNNTTEMINPIYHEISREDLGMFAQNMQTGIEAMNKTAANAAVSIGASTAAVADIAIGLRKDFRKEKKRKTQQRVAVSTAELLYIQEYDNGTEDALPLIVNTSGSFEIYRICFPEECKARDLCCISFINENINILCRADAKGREIYEAAVYAGIQFNSQIPISTIIRLLGEFFMPLIRECQNERIALYLPGWEYGYYKTKRDALWMTRGQCYPEVPITHKELRGDTCEIIHIRDYIKKIKKFKEKRLRLWMLTFPFMSILSSVLSGYRYNRQFFINAVVSSPALEELILYFTQTFNRHCLSAYSVDNPKSNLQAMLSKAKDETMVISAKLLENVSVYSKKKVAENISLVTDIATGRKNLGSPYNRPAYFGLVIVSDVPVTESSSEIRLFLEEEDIDKSLIDEMGYNFQDTVGIVMADFIASVEMHWDDIEAILREYHVGNDKVATVEVVLEILKGYFWTKGLEIMVELDIKDVNLGSLFETEIEDRNMLLELVRKIVREEIMCTSVREIRNTYEACPWEIYYSEDVVLVPSDLMEQWLKKHDLWHLKKQLQVILRQNKVLYYTDGYTYRFRKNQTACETWKLRRDFFTKLGETELINLGRQVSC